VNESMLTWAEVPPAQRTAHWVAKKKQETGIRRTRAILVAAESAGHGGLRALLSATWVCVWLCGRQVKSCQRALCGEPNAWDDPGCLAGVNTKGYWCGERGAVRGKHYAFATQP